MRNFALPLNKAMVLPWWPGSSTMLFPDVLKMLEIALTFFSSVHLNLHLTVNFDGILFEQLYMIASIHRLLYSSGFATEQLPISNLFCSLL